MPCKASVTGAGLIAELRWVIIIAVVRLCWAFLGSGLVFGYRRFLFELNHVDQSSCGSDCEFAVVDVVCRFYKFRVQVSSANTIVQRLAGRRIVECLAGPIESPAA